MGIFEKKRQSSNMTTNLFLYFFLWILLPSPSCQDAQTRTSIRSVTAPKREVRAFWIVTLDNKDFPSQPGLSNEMQREELRNILDYHQKQGMNTAIFQIRPSADAFYASSIEPWSEWLMGQQGQAPQPFYDPLAFLVEECHQRNMELHVWLNPYRVVYNVELSDVKAQPLMRKHSDWLITYGKHQQLNPGLPEVRSYILSVIMDVVRRYDVDGIQFDDYFYPYKIWKKEFPDESTFRRYGQGFRDKSDWRRDNVSQLIKMVHDSLQQTKPHIKFGISPMGVWRNIQDDPRGSDTQAGQPSYDYLGADVLAWLEEGWIDYVAPQLYWSIGHPRADYATLVKWWSKNTFGRHLYIGQAFYKINQDDDKKWYRSSEIPDQIRLNRTYPEVSGSIFFRAKNLMDNPRGATDSLGTNFYAFPALIPTMPWKDKIAPNVPQSLRKIRTPKRVLLKWEAPEIAKDGEIAHYYIVYRFTNDENPNISQTQNIVSIQKETQFVEKKPSETGEYIYAITALDRLHNESEPTFLRVDQ